MSILLFGLNDPFMLLVPEFVVGFEGGGAFNFPSEPNFVQQRLSILSKSIALMTAPLHGGPVPWQLVLPVLLWHHTMALLLFELDELFTPLVPELVLLVKVVVTFTFPSEPDFVFDQVEVRCWRGLPADC
jgi:hypothetical protein